MKTTRRGLLGLLLGALTTPFIAKSAKASKPEAMSVSELNRHFREKFALLQEEGE